MNDNELMKTKDKVRLETLRNVKKCFLEAKTAPGANDTLTSEVALIRFLKSEDRNGNINSGKFKLLSTPYSI